MREEKGKMSSLLANGRTGHHRLDPARKANTAHHEHNVVGPYVTSDPVQKSTYARGSKGVEEVIDQIWAETRQHNPDRFYQVQLIHRLPKTHTHHAMNTLAYDMKDYCGYIKQSSTRYTKHVTSTIGDDRGHMLQHRKMMLNLGKDQPHEDRM